VKIVPQEDREYGAGGGIRTHEPLQDRLLKPTPLTWLGDPRTNASAVGSKLDGAQFDFDSRLLLPVVLFQIGFRLYLLCECFGVRWVFKPENCNSKRFSVCDLPLSVGIDF
jgi:hypothetical protein